MDRQDARYEFELSLQQESETAPQRLSERRPLSPLLCFWLTLCSNRCGERSDFTNRGAAFRSTKLKLQPKRLIPGRVKK
jgi:hypothetical protein